MCKYWNVNKVTVLHSEGNCSVIYNVNHINLLFRAIEMDEIALFSARIVVNHSHSVNHGNTIFIIL